MRNGNDFLWNNGLMKESIKTINTGKVYKYKMHIL